VLEAGCGQGGFLERLAQGAARDGRKLGGAVGFDPAYRGPTAAPGAAVRIEARLFDREAAQAIGRAIDMNPNYRGEIAATVQRQGWPFELWEG
jgi:hypothetical protein